MTLLRRMCRLYCDNYFDPELDDLSIPHGASTDCYKCGRRLNPLTDTIHVQRQKFITAQQLFDAIEKECPEFKGYSYAERITVLNESIKELHQMFEASMLRKPKYESIKGDE